MFLRSDKGRTEPTARLSLRNVGSDICRCGFLDRQLATVQNVRAPRPARRISVRDMPQIVNCVVEVCEFGIARRFCRGALQFTDNGAQPRSPVGACLIVLLVAISMPNQERMHLGAQL